MSLRLFFTRIFHELFYQYIAYACHRVAAVVEEVLHSDHTGIVAEKTNAVIRAILPRGITQRRHLCGIMKKSVKPTDTGTRRCNRGRLRNSIYPHFLFESVSISKASGDTFHEC